MLISGTHETRDGLRIAGWFGRFVGKPQFGPYAALGCLKGDDLCNAAMFNDYNGANIELHMAGTITRPLLRGGLRYAFRGLNVQRITAKPYRSNEALIDILLRLGFVPEFGEVEHSVMQRYYGPNDDAVLFRLDRHAAEKWMT